MKEMSANPAFNGANKNLVAFCGLYCGACKRFLTSKCPGCRENKKATWCKVRTCCLESVKTSCANCQDFTSASECKKFNNIFSKLFALIFRSNRQACIDRIKEIGCEAYAQEMAQKGTHSLRKK